MGRLGGLLTERISDLLLGLAGNGIVTTFASDVGALAEAGRVAMGVVSVAGAAFVIVSQPKSWPALA